jgi:elongation factor P--beta-lysine ligase
VVREGAAHRVTLALEDGPGDADGTILDAFAADPQAAGDSVGVALPEDRLVALASAGDTGAPEA